jgi:hypothetical protein
MSGVILITRFCLIHGRRWRCRWCRRGSCGVLDVQSRQADAFALDDLNVLQQMADHVAAAIYNARLFTAVQQRNQRQREIIGLWQKISLLRQEKDILSVTAERLVTQFGYSGAYIGKLVGSDLVVQAAASQPGLKGMEVGLRRRR